jgi:hypothetical protein
MHAEAPSALHGTLAEFDTADGLLNAANAAREAGYRQMDAYTPFPIHELSDALGYRHNVVPWIMAIGGICGTTFGLFLQWYTNAFDYPLNIGGKPLVSLPMYVPVCFESTVLWSALTGFFGMWILNGLPRPHHPIFSGEHIERATVDRFFLCIEAKDPKYEGEKVRAFLQAQSPLNVSIVEEPED